MNWNYIETLEDLEKAKSASNNQPVILFKHSTRCSISGMALNRMERSWNVAEMEGVQAYFVDLIQHRELSNTIAQTFQIRHESPQLLLILNESCVYNTSHMGISYQELRNQIAKMTA